MNSKEFLLTFSDMLRPLADPVEIQETAARLLGEHLGANRVGYAEDNGDNDHVIVRRSYTRDVPEVRGLYRYEDYGGLLPELRAGRTVVRPDIADDPFLNTQEKQAHAILQMGASVNVPLVKAGRLVAVLFAHYEAARRISEEEVSLLEDVAERIWEAAERARAEEALRTSEVRMQRVLDTDAVGVLFFDDTGTVIDCNEPFLRMTGYTQEHVQRRELTWQRMTPPEYMAVSEQQMELLARTGKIGPYEKEYLLLDGSRRWMLFTGRDMGDGTISEYCIDIEDRKRAEEALRDALAEKDALLKEVHHRVKNNLQVITSLLEMQARQMADQASLAHFREARNRVISISAMHELLYSSGSFAHVDIGDYARKLVPHVVGFYRAQNRIRVSIEGRDVALDLERGVPFGLLLNELIANVCKHAFPGDRAGELTVRLSQSQEEIKLEVIDTGVGFSRGETSTLGLQLVSALAEQLDGQVAFTRNGGTHVEVRMPRRS